MWVVTPDYMPNSVRLRGVISVETIVRAAHLIPAYGPDFLPSRFDANDALDVFVAYYVNKYVDHHAHTLTF